VLIESLTRRLDALSERVTELQRATIKNYEDYDLSLTQSPTHPLGHLQQHMDELYDDNSETYANYKHESADWKRLLREIAANMEEHLKQDPAFEELCLLLLSASDKLDKELRVTPIKVQMYY
jgi:DNA-binding ferritin-like protein